LPLEDQLTGFGVVVGAAAAAEWLGDRLAGMRVAIEGFGKVGAGAAKYFAREGARVVAVSTLHGTLYAAEGLDVARLLALRSRHGDAALDEYGAGPLLPTTALFRLPADVLVPGARPDVVDDVVAAAVTARIVAPAANIPYAGSVPAVLHRRGIVPLPDFVTNAGGVLTGLVDLQGGTAADAFSMVRNRIASNVRFVLDTARRDGVSAYDAGMAIARTRLASSSVEA
jgi:glutamate dehydrogenase/leucine dehydrogenase